jgi:hypothetical protein
VSSMPPSNSPLPGESPFRDITYSETEETHPGVDAVDGLLRKMKLSTGHEVSVDELAHTLKNTLISKGTTRIFEIWHTLSCRSILKIPLLLLQRLPLLRRENAGLFFRRGSNPRMPSLRSLSRSRGASLRVYPMHLQLENNPNRYPPAPRCVRNPWPDTCVVSKKLCQTTRCQWYSSRSSRGTCAVPSNARQGHHDNNNCNTHSSDDDKSPFLIFLITTIEYGNF